MTDTVLGIVTLCIAFRVAAAFGISAAIAEQRAELICLVYGRLLFSTLLREGFLFCEAFGFQSSLFLTLTLQSFRLRLAPRFLFLFAEVAAHAVVCVAHRHALGCHARV